MSTFALGLRLVASLEDCEDAIVAGLQADATIASYARQVVAFQGTWEEARREVLRLLPGIAVVYVGGRLEPQGPARAVHHAEWQVVVAAKNLRSERAAHRPSASGEVGAYQMVQDVLRVLGRADLAVNGMGGLAPQQVHPVHLKSGGQGLAVYTCVFVAPIDMAPPTAEDDLSTVAMTLSVANPDETDGTTTWSEIALETVTDLEAE